MTNILELEPLAIGDAIDTAEKFNTLPIGATLTDDDGWIHTKVADWAEQGPHATTFVAPDGREDTFKSCFNWGTTLTSLPEPEPEPDRTAELEDIIASLRIDLAQARSETDQANAAQALEAHRANKAEARAANLQVALDYAITVSNKTTQGRVLGYIDRINHEASK